MKNETVLHQWEISPFCGKVRRVLDHKGIPYRTQNYNGILAPKATSLSKVGKLPVLEIDGLFIQDSRKIAAWLEANYPQKPLMPSAPARRAEVEIWQDWADESLYWYNLYFRLNYDDAWEKCVDAFSEGRPVWEKFLVGQLGRRRYLGQLQGHGLGRAPRADVEARFLILLGSLNAVLADREFLVDGWKTLADIAVASPLHEILRTSHLAATVRKHENVARWLQRV